MAHDLRPWVPGMPRSHRTRTRRQPPGVTAGTAGRAAAAESRPLAQGCGDRRAPNVVRGRPGCTQARRRGRGRRSVWRRGRRCGPGTPRDNRQGRPPGSCSCPVNLNERSPPVYAWVLLRRDTCRACVKWPGAVISCWRGRRVRVARASLLVKNLLKAGWTHGDGSYSDADGDCW